MKFEIAGTAQEGMLDRETIYKKIFNMSDEEIEKIRDGKKFDRIEDLTLEAMTAPPEVGAGAGEEGMAGAEELPSTLGGAEGGEPPASGGGSEPQAGGEAPVQPEAVDHGQVMEVSLNEIGMPSCELCNTEPKWSYESEIYMCDCGNLKTTSVGEKKNMGSTGDRAEVAVDKGKDLFATGEDLHTSVFGTEKQTASDPGDLRALRRVVTRPFSEKISRGEKVLREQANKMNEVQRDIDAAAAFVQNLKQ
jgi:hypothetical protein